MQGCFPWFLAALGLAGLIAAIAVSPADARSAAAQDWSPFVLVTGLLLIGLVAEYDGLFAAAGHRLARASSSGIILFAGATVMIAVVTAVLNLDTSVAFLTPVLVYTARTPAHGPTVNVIPLVHEGGSKEDERHEAAQAYPRADRSEAPRG